MASIIIPYNYVVIDLSLREGYCKWFGKMPVCVSDSTVPQELDALGLPYLMFIDSSEVARTSTC